MRVVFFLLRLSVDICWGRILNFCINFEAGEMLHVAAAFIDKNYHPTVICRGNICRECHLFYLCVCYICLVVSENV